MTDPQPWWLRALEPLRSEQAMFQVLVYVLVIAAILVAAVAILRALT